MLTSYGPWLQNEKNLLFLDGLGVRLPKGRTGETITGAGGGSVVGEVDGIATERTLLIDKAKLGAEEEIGFVTRLGEVCGELSSVVDEEVVKPTLRATAGSTSVRQQRRTAIETSLAQQCFHPQKRLHPANKQKI